MTPNNCTAERCPIGGTVLGEECDIQNCYYYTAPTKKEEEPCYVCENLEEGDTLYKSSDWDGGIGFDYIREIKYCPVCGRRLK